MLSKIGSFGLGFCKSNKKLCHEEIRPTRNLGAVRDVSGFSSCPACSCEGKNTKAIPMIPSNAVAHVL